jgi:bacterioferritin
MEKSATTALDNNMPRKEQEGVVNTFLGLTDVPDAPSPARQGVENGATTSGCEADAEIVIRLLNEALATEIICILRYKRHYFMAVGSSALRVKEKFLQYVAEERAHADQLAERIVQLGGKLDLSPERLLSRSHAEHVEGGSLAEMITADLLAERLSIDNYRAMIDSIGDDDATTRRVLERILMQEEQHEENLASLLRA